MFMNKIEYNGKEILDIDKVNQTIEDTKKQVFSDQVKRIEIVNDYPETEENGVLYIKLDSSLINNKFQNKIKDFFKNKR